MCVCIGVEFNMECENKRDKVVTVEHNPRTT